MKQNQLELEKEKYIHSNYHETLIFERYVCQKKLMTALELGDAKQAYDILQTLWADIRTVNALYSPERENFRVLHNQLVSMNTFCLLCAIKSAPNPLYLHAISRHYDTMIEKATSKEDADILLKNMLEDYCSFSNYTEHGKYSDVVQKAIWHVTANPESKLNLENLAHVLGISPAGLSRKFHAETGQTFSQYHIAFRIRMARRYLQEGGYSITQVAHLTGFTDASYFSKVFAKHMGESPSAYLQKEQ